MPRQPARSRRLAAALLWPVGIALTSWNYMWRTTPMHRSEREGAAGEDAPPPLPADIARDELQPAGEGAGPLFHRRYRVGIDGSALAPEELIARVRANLNEVAPTEFARFHRVAGEGVDMAVGDEYVVHMPGPWNGPVRVVEVTPRSFRLATLAGHLEAGQIDFRAERAGDGRVAFTIESWARSGDRLSNLLYHKLRMAKEVQLHMWTSFLERVVGVAGGRRFGRIEIVTRRVEDGDAARPG